MYAALNTNAKLQKLHPQTERVNVKVTSDFDSTGFMLPRSITWADGRVFRIDSVRDYRPATVYSKNLPGDCYTVIIHGQERHLFFERTDPLFASRFGRWFVERTVEQAEQAEPSKQAEPSEQAERRANRTSV